MRGHKARFHALGRDIPLQFFVVSLPYKYVSHYVETPSGPTKKNCHEVDCPFCAHGLPRRVGLYVIILTAGGGLAYFDISKALYAEMSKTARAECQATGTIFTDLGAFLDSHLVTVIKTTQDGKFKGYEVYYEGVEPGHMAQIKEQLMNEGERLGRVYRRLILGFPDLVRPGTVEEDGEAIYAV